MGGGMGGMQQPQGGMMGSPGMGGMQQPQGGMMGGGMGGMQQPQGGMMGGGMGGMQQPQGGMMGGGMGGGMMSPAPPNQAQPSFQSPRQDSMGMGGFQL